MVITVVQVACRSGVLVASLSEGLSERLARVLFSPEVIKCGVDVGRTELNGLHRQFFGEPCPPEVLQSSAVELGALARATGVLPIEPDTLRCTPGLSTVASMCGISISKPKKITMGRWDAVPLSPR